MYEILEVQGSISVNVKFLVNVNISVNSEFSGEVLSHL